MTGSVAVGIENIIKEKGFIQAAIAAKSGFSEQQFSDMLNGRKVIRADFMVPIAKAMGVSVQEIYDAGSDAEAREPLSETIGA